MSYQVLARKWRPGSFREMVGQQHVLRALINALDHDRLHHAYLFTGTRGVGKTTVARILAKCLNCETAISSEPCGRCSTCIEIAEGRSVDVLEVDAASRTKVDDTRELLENVQYAPTRSRFKLYIIDEVHMLSNSSFNALLKTLEEPPPHAKFLLATTDPQKLPATVLSRCLQFNLKNMLPEQVVEHLRHILNAEGISFDDAALGLLGRAAAGSMRDALSLTDQAIAFGSGSLREGDVRDMLGTVDRSRVVGLAEAVAAGDAKAVLDAVAAIAEHAPDYPATLDELASLFHQITVAQMVPGSVDTTWGDAERITALAEQLTLDDSQLFYQFALNGRRDLALAPDPRVGLEMALLRMIAFRPADIIVDPSTAGDGAPPVKKSEPPVPPVVSAAQTSASVAPARAPEATSTAALATTSTAENKVPAPELSATGASAPETPPSPKAPVTEPSTSVEAVSEPSAPVAILDEGDEDVPSRASWPEFFEQLGLVGITYTIALHCELRSIQGRALQFVLDRHNATLFQPRQTQALELAFNQYLERPVQVSIEVGDVGEATPARRREQLAAERQQLAERSIADDPVLAALLTEFDAQVIDGSIRPPS